MSTTHTLPQLDADLFLADGGMETTLIFDDGFDLPDFAAFTLLASADGRAALRRYYDRYIDVATRAGVGVVLDTATWRASADWGRRQGLDADGIAAANREAVALVDEVRRRRTDATAPILVSGAVGPRGDGYQASEMMSAADAEAYHRPQVEQLAAAGADVISAITMTYPAEAIGVVEAARRVGAPVVVSFTVETDGSLPTGGSLRSAIEQVDAATGSYASYFMINCAHPIHFAATLEPGAAWTGRIRGMRSNASTMSHAELDEAETLDGGDPLDLGRRYRTLRESHPHLTVLGGCCGTNHSHIDAIAQACTSVSAGPT